MRDMLLIAYRRYLKRNARKSKGGGWSRRSAAVGENEMSFDCAITSIRQGMVESLELQETSHVLNRTCACVQCYLSTASTCILS